MLLTFFENELVQQIASTLPFLETIRLNYCIPLMLLLSISLYFISLCIESETFDLAGSTPTMIEHMIRDAFTLPFDHLTEMIRLTFITGAGK